MKKLIALTIAAVSLVGAFSAPAKAEESPAKFACSTGRNVLIRDYRTFKPVGKLQRGECMNLVADPQTDSGYIIEERNGKSFYIVTGISGRQRLLSTQFSRLRY